MAAGWRLRDALTSATPTLPDEPNVQPMLTLDKLAAEISRTNNALVHLQAQQHEIERNIEEVTSRLRQLQGQLAERVTALGIKAEVVG